MAEKQSITVELRPQQLAYLEQIIAKHGIADVGKAVRVLVDFARDEPDHESLIFNEKRCINCGRE